MSTPTEDAPRNGDRDDPAVDPAAMEIFRGSLPTWTRWKKLALGVALGTLLAVTLLRGLVLVAGETNPLARAIPGLAWISERDAGTGETVARWHWPEITFAETSWLELEVNVKVFLDMLAGGALGTLLALAFGMTSMRETPAKRILRRMTVAALFAMVLVYTYHWCDIDPVAVWTSRGNAWRHLAGRSFSEEEITSIRAEAERAPEYYAEGEASYILAQRYKDTPPDQTPSTFEKQKEQRQIKKDLLSRMSASERSTIVEQEYARLLDKKKGGYWPPELAPRRIWVYFTALLETIAIAIWASLLAVLCAVPLSVLAASNTLDLIAPGDGRIHRAIRWVGVFVVRRFLDACRGFNELVMALIFVSVIGLGPFAGILALWIHTTGILGKVFSEAIEAIDPGQVEALVGAGAGSTQTISFSVMPQVMPTVISYSLLRFESNVRSAAILGWVGAGGIGFLLQDKMVGYNHREVCTMMIMIIAAVSLIDFFCGKLRKRFI
jgi:phosphonate transport system permease protein